MNKLLKLLIKEASVMALAEEARQAIRRMVMTAIIYLIVGVFGVATLAFVYVLIYRLLAEALDGDSAAAIVIGGNLLIIGLILGVRAISRGASGRRRSRRRNAGEQAALTAEAVEIGRSAIEAGMVVGSRLGQKLRRAAPEIALAAAVVGLIIGVRPQLLTIFRSQKAPRPKQN